MADLGTLTTLEPFVKAPIVSLFVTGSNKEYRHGLSVFTSQLHTIPYYIILEEFSGGVEKAQTKTKRILTTNIPFDPNWVKLPLGSGKICGTLKVEGVPWENKLVRLYRKSDGVKVNETATDINGYYEFLYVQSDLYYVIASHQGFNAVVMDDIQPVMQ